MRVCADFVGHNQLALREMAVGVGRPLTLGTSRHSYAPRTNFIRGAETPEEARLLVHLQSGQKHTPVPEERAVRGLPGLACAGPRLSGCRKDEGPQAGPQRAPPPVELPLQLWPFVTSVNT